jgi:hypothetical protein
LGAAAVTHRYWVASAVTRRDWEEVLAEEEGMGRLEDSGAGIDLAAKDKR